MSLVNRIASAITLLFLAFSIAVQGQTDGTDKLTSANWREHPKIEAVREIVRTVNEGWEKREFKTTSRNLEGCGDTFTQFRRLTVDSKGIVRRYEMQFTAEDSGGTEQYYFDDAGQLRFVLIEGSAGNGSRLRHRIYFDENGKRLWEEHSVKGGPGHYWPQKWPDDQLHKTDAAKAFARTGGCTEVKRTSK